MPLDNQSSLEYLMTYYDEIRQDEHARYKSWEHCHEFFINHKDAVTDDILDLMSLHLGFYLASWGMLRASFLMQKSYKIHIEPIKVLLLPKYSVLWRITPNDLIKKDNLHLLFECAEQLNAAYAKQLNCRMPTITLTTKILLGVYGCVPAYDRYFVSAIKQHNGSGQFSANSIRQLCQFCIDNEPFFSSAEKLIGNPLYSDMKILDMLFWQIGYDVDKKNENMSLGIALRTPYNTASEIAPIITTSDFPRKSTSKTNNPSVQQVTAFLLNKLQSAKDNGLDSITIVSRDLIKEVGLIQASPTACSAMYTMQTLYPSVIISSPPKGVGHSLEIQYFLNHR